MKTRMKKKTLHLMFILSLVLGTMVGVSGTASASAPVLLSGSSWLGGQGVNVCAPSTDPDCGGQTHVGGWSGNWWQCVELAQRLYQARGWHGGIFAGVSYAYQIYDQAPALNMSRQANGSVGSLTPGDMIIHGSDTPYSGGAGHVSIVDSVVGSTVNVVEQNTYNNQPRGSYSLTNGTLTRPNTGTIRGVVHDPDNTSMVANGTDTFGSYDSSTAKFYITNAMQPTVAEATFPYGNAGWKPLIGDWNGDGKDTFGSYNPATATFYITNAMQPTVAEATFVYGNVGWIPLIGDWDGNGTDTFGSYNPATATFYITNAMQPTVAEATFVYGNSGWTPLIGDWDGNGTDTFGSYNPSTATFYITNAMQPSVAEATFVYGNVGWKPLIGDWNGDRKDTFGSYDPSTAMFYITNAMQPTIAEATFTYGNPGWIPLIGDWDGS